MARFVFDLETNGLLDDLTTIHSLVMKDVDTGEVLSLSANVRDGVRLLKEADLIIGHNIIGFDIPAILKVKGVDLGDVPVFDTMVAASLVWPTDLRKERDFKANKDAGFPGHLIGRNSLESWGHRFGHYKGDYKGPWDRWSQEMQEYCEQDVAVTETLYRKLLEAGIDGDLDMEQAVKRIVSRQERHGFGFDEAGATELYTTLAKERLRLEAELQETFRPWWARVSEFTPKRDNAPQGYTKGCTFTRTALVTFNPGSRDHIADRLTKLRGWKPTAHGKDGKPTVDETVLSALPFPEAKLIHEYLMIQKRIGQVAEGKEAWLGKVKGGAIHGRVHTNEAVTGRMTHSGPNVAQVPAVGVPYGAECRALFRPQLGGALVGVDASGLELRCLAGYMHPFDGGNYVDVVLNGDVHQVTADAVGIDRNTAKRVMYALIYGAGDEKLGLVVGATGGSRKLRAAGREVRDRLLSGIPGLGTLIGAVQGKAHERGYLIGLDGRHLHIRSPHAALNTLLQSAGALLMKRALVILDTSLQDTGFVPGMHYEFAANIHDEWQIDTAQETNPDEIGKHGVRAITAAGEAFGFPCPLDGEYKVGRNWAGTH